MERVEQEGVGILGSSFIHQPMAGRILDRAVIFPIVESQSVFCIDRVNSVADFDGDHHFQPEHKAFFGEKRGT